MDSPSLKVLLIMEDRHQAGHIIDSAHNHNGLNITFECRSRADASAAPPETQQADLLLLQSSPDEDNHIEQLAEAYPGTLILLFNDAMTVNSRWLNYAIQYVLGRRHAEQSMVLARQALLEEKDLIQMTLDSIGDAVLCCDLNGKVTYMNTEAQRLTGWQGRSSLGRPVTEVMTLIESDSRRIVTGRAQMAIEHNCSIGLDADCVLLLRDGTEVAIDDTAAPIHDQQGNAIGSVIVLHDVSQSRAKTQRIYHQAHHDHLTDLPNRALLDERLNQAISMARRHDLQVGLLFIDLDYFKQINDSLGHENGDLLLQSVSERLKTCVRDSDTVSRHGGDEFVVLLAEMQKSNDAMHVAQKILKAFVKPHQLGQNSQAVTLSIGISVYPHDAENAQMMLQHADSAMYQAKSEGRDHYQFYRKPDTSHNSDPVQPVRIKAVQRG